MYWKKTLASLVCLTSSSMLYSDQNVTTSTQLQNAIVTYANTGADTTINFTASPIDLTVAFGAPNLRPLNVMNNFTPTAFPITINGNGNMLSSGGLGTPHRGFFVRGGNVTLNNIVFNQLASVGGNGGSSGGGGGAGIGGALIVGSGSNVTAVNCVFQNSIAQGGTGGPAGNAAINGQGGGGGGGLVGAGGIGSDYSAAGGGGLDHSGGSATTPGADLYNGGGGGGVGNNGGDESSSSDPNAGFGGGDYSGAVGGAGGIFAVTSPPRDGIMGPPGGGGGGGYQCCSSTFGCFCGPIAAGKGGDGNIGGGGGAGGAGDANTSSGGKGGDFGGGGAGNNGAPGGKGGFCGGGGCGGVSFTGSLNNPAGAGGGSVFGGGGGGGGGANTGGPFPGGLGGIHGFGGGDGSPGAVSGPDVSGYYPNGAGGGGAGFGGAIFIQTGGALALQNNVSFTGNSVAGGAGGAASGGASAGMNGSGAGSDIFMMSGSNLSFDISNNVALQNPIEGDQGAGGGSTSAGGLTKSGPALLQLSGANTYTGITNVQAGTLQIGTSVVTDVEVQSGATLTGTFSIFPNTAGTNNGNLTNSGTVSPGVNQLGVITISGNFINNSNGTLAIGITPSGTNGSLFLPTGTSLLNGGILEVFVNSGAYTDGTQYTVINSPTIGTFAQLVQTGPMANRLVIDVAYSSVVLTIRNNPIFNPAVITSSVARAVANCITSALPFTDPDFAAVVQNIGRLSNSQINRALIDLSPVNYGALDWINERNNNYLADILSERLFELCCSPRDCCSCDCNRSVWIDVFVNLMNNSKHYDNLSPFDANAVGVATGLDYCFNSFTLGAAFAYTHTWLNWKHRHGNSDINSYYGALYGNYEGCWLNADISFIGGGSDHHLKRKIDIRGADVLTGAPVVIDRSAKSHPWGYFFTGHLGLRTDWDWCCTTIEPFGLIDYNYFQRQSFKEHGAESLNLKVKQHTQNMLRGEAGLRAYRTWVCECSCFAPYIGLSWVGEFPLGHSKQKASFTGQSCVIDVTSYHSSIQLASPQAGVKWTQNSGFSFLVGYKGLYNSKTSINEVDASVEWVF